MQLNLACLDNDLKVDSPHTNVFSFTGKFRLGSKPIKGDHWSRTGYHESHHNFGTEAIVATFDSGKNDEKTELLKAVSADVTHDAFYAVIQTLIAQDEVGPVISLLETRVRSIQDDRRAWPFRASLNRSKVRNARDVSCKR